MSDVQPSLILYIGFIGLPLILTAGLTYLSRSWKLMMALIIWAGFTAILALTGIAADFSILPPPILLLLVTGFILVTVLAFSRIGTSLTELSSSFIIGFLAFRIFVEVLIHRAVLEGVAPLQMSWNGLNFDILAGISALFIAPIAGRLPKSVLIIWNTLALGLVLWTVSVAIRSLPIPIQQFEPVGLWVTQFPFLWLPLILVPFALLGHLLLYRKLIAKQRAIT